MDFFKAKLITLLLAFGLITGAAIGAILYYVFPQYYPQCYEGILIFFLLIESLILIYVESASRKVTDRKLLNAYMLTKVVKIFAAIIFILAYIKAVGEDIKSFVLVFMIFYLLFLGFEAFLFLKIEKRIKKK